MSDVDVKPAGLLAARAALARGDAAGAAAVARQFPDQAEAHFLMGLAEAAQGRVSAGIGHVQRAIAIEALGEYWAQLARLLSLVHRDGEAAQALAAAERAPPADALSLDTMGCVYARLGDHPASVPCFEAAVALAPGNRAFRYNLAVALSFVGRTDDAEAALEALIALDPLAGRPHHTLAGLRKQTTARNHVDRLKVAHQGARGPEDRLLFGYALSKELEDLGDAGESFQWLSRANAEHRATLAYAFDTDAAIFDAIEAHWRDLGDPPADAPAEAPVFIVGMPRTGTTLVDRIIGSHPQMESVGELQAMPVAVKLATGVRTRTVLDPETVRAAAACDMAGIGRAYLDRAIQHQRDPARRLIDKFPGNFFYLGLMARALPQAKFVCLRRQPMDVVLSNFKNLFATTSRYYDYSYDLAEIAEYYVRFDRLMGFWREQLPGRVLEIGYEDLVADQEGQTRRLLAHCGLEWSDSCLDFHNSAAPVSTPSAAQVRRPIYKDSVSKWRIHAEAFEPALRVFERHGIAVE